MNDFVRWTRRRLLALTTVLVVMTLSTPAVATGQEGRTYRACYVPEVGAVYLIGDEGLPTECRSDSHVAFSWTDGGGDATTDAATTSGTADGDLTRSLLTDGVRQATDGFAVTGERDTGEIPAEGAGVRLMWYPGKAAFRVGEVVSDEWDDGKIGSHSMAMGSRTVASGNYSTAMGIDTKASGDYSTAMGIRTEASGRGSTAMGAGSEASGLYSTAMGLSAHALHDGTFVWSDDRNEFSSTEQRQFLIHAANGVGIGTNTPRTQLDVSREVNGSAGIDNHVVHFRNTASSNGDVLVLHSDASDPVASNVNFITFRSADGNIGSIEGDGSGGISLNTSGADIAERLPRLQIDEVIEPGQVVGLFGGAVSKATAGADQLMVVTDRAVVLGNDPGPDARGDYEKVAFLGQVPVEVSGPVEPGDLLVASGRDDGAAHAVSPADYRPAVDGPVVGQAWEESAGGARRVKALVGAHGRAAALQRVVERQQARLELLEEKVNRLIQMTGRDNQ